MKTTKMILQINFNIFGKSACFCPIDRDKVSFRLICWTGPNATMTNEDFVATYGTCALECGGTIANCFTGV